MALAQLDRSDADASWVDVEVSMACVLFTTAPTGAGDDGDARGRATAHPNGLGLHFYISASRDAPPTRSNAAHAW
jgi:hypothetical protein